MAKKCRISLFNVVTPSGAVTYGYRCLSHGVLTQRFSTPEIRDQRIAGHKESPKSTKKY